MNRNKQPHLSGIQIENTISMAIQNKNHRRNPFYLVVIALFGTLGGAFTFLSMFELQYHKPAVMCLLLTEFVISTVFALNQGKWRPLKLLSGFAYAALLYLFRLPFSTGFIHLVNTIYKVIYLTEWERFTISEDFSAQYATTVFLVLAFFPIILMLCYAVIHFQNFFLSLIATFPYVEIGFYFGVAANHLFAIMLYAFWFSMAAVHMSNFGAYHGKEQNSFLRRENTFFPVTSMRFMVTEKIGILVLCIVMVLCVGVEQILQITEYKRSEDIKELRRNVQEQFNSLMLNDPENFLGFTGLNRKIGKDRVVVKLGREEKQQYRNVSISGLTFSDLPEGRIYLKYITGEIYSDNTWGMLPLDVYKNNEVFETFEALHYYPQDFLYQNMSRVCPQNITMSMRNLNRVVNQSVPYGFKKNAELVYLHDNQFTNFPTSYEIIQNHNFEEVLIEDFDAHSQFDGYATHFAEQGYLEFVREHHTVLPETQAMQNVRDSYAYLVDGFRADATTPSETIYFLQELREAVSQNSTYTLAPGRTPVDRDFVEYFLMDNHKGYCMHYATAGVVLARMAGIPARYCEGYMLDCSNNPTLKKTQIDGKTVYVVDVLDSNAHAWIEVYIDGWGWIPFEFTYTQAEEVPVPSEPVIETTAPTAPTVPAATTSPVISTTAPVQVPQPGVPEEKAEVNILPFLIVLGCLLVIASIFSVIYLLWEFSVRKRNRLFTQKNTNAAAVCVYSYLLRLLSYCGVNTRVQRVAEITEQGIEKCGKYLGDYKLEDAVDIAAKAKFSHHTITKAELALLIKITNRLAKAIYRDSSFMRRIRFRFFQHMI